MNLETPVFDKIESSNDGVLYSGIGSLLDPDNQFVFPILRAEKTTVSVTSLDTSDETPYKISQVSGEQLTLVAGF